MFSLLNKIDLASVADGLTGSTQPSQSVTAHRIPVSKNILQECLYRGGPLLSSKSEPGLSGIVTNLSYLNTDGGTINRASIDLGNSIVAICPSDLGNDFLAKCSSRDVSFVYQESGIPGAETALIGVAHVAQKIGEVEFTHAIGDKKGSFINGASIGSNVAQASAAGALLAHRGLSMDSILGSSNPLIGRVDTGFVQAGLGLWAVKYSLDSVISGIKLFEGFKLRNKLGKSEKLEDQVKVIQDKLRVKDPNELLEKLFKKDPNIIPKLVKEGLDTYKDSIRELMKTLNIPSITDKEFEEIILKSLDLDTSQKLDKLDITKLPPEVEEWLYHYALQQRVQIKAIKNRHVLERILGTAGFEAVKKLEKELKKDPKLLEGIRTNVDAKAKVDELMGKIKASNKDTLIENILLIVFYVLGVAAMVTGIVFTGGILGIVACALMLGFSLIGTGVDMYYLYQSYKGERPLAHDKKLMGVSTILGVASFVAYITLVLTGVLAFGPLGFGIALVLFLIWMAQNGYTWYVMSEIENKNLEKARVKLLNAINENKPDKKLEAIIGKISESVQEVLKKDKDVRIEATISRIEKVKADRLKNMREDIESYVARLKDVTPQYHVQTA